MKKTGLFFLFLAIFSCTEKEEIDQEKPQIDLNYSQNFPTSCVELKRGEKFIFKARFTDNVTLGSYNIEMHHNFDHHNHDTQVGSCSFEAKKTAVNPFKFNQSFSIPSGKEFLAQQEILIPSDVDSGDYHLMIKLTDASGWATLRGISVKIVP